MQRSLHPVRVPQWEGGDKNRAACLLIKALRERLSSVFPPRLQQDLRGRHQEQPCHDAGNVIDFPAFKPTDLGGRLSSES